MRKAPQMLNGRGVCIEHCRFQARRKQGFGDPTRLGDAGGGGEAGMRSGEPEVRAESSFREELAHRRTVVDFRHNKSRQDF